METNHAELVGQMHTTPEMIKWEHLIRSSVVWLYGRPAGRHAYFIFPYRQ